MRMALYKRYKTSKCLCGGNARKGRNEAGCWVITCESCGKCVSLVDRSKSHVKWNKMNKVSYNICVECGNKKRPSNSKFCSDECRRRGYDYYQHLKSESQCVLCGEGRGVCLDFHHTRDKSFALSRSKSKSQKEVKAEIEKCIVVCKNCHAVIHNSRD